MIDNSASAGYRQKDDPYCQCGRLTQKVHCPHCGSYVVYGLASKRDTATRSDGNVVRLAVYRCRRCAATFNDDDWMFRCTAPHERLGRRPKEAEKPLQFETEEQIPEHMKAALEMIKKQRGIV